MKNTLLQGFNFYTETKTVTSLWRSDDAAGGKVSTAMPVHR
jgi:malonate-semialdehyde dehydrogenase (acetylating)/methylmalonate-semialdehyde dehydrogenase